MIVAIDGPAGSGKGTLARRLSIYLRAPHLDSGKLYRQLALLADELRIAPGEVDRLYPIVERIDVLNLDNPQLSSGRAGTLAASYSKIPTVRDKISTVIRDFAAKSAGAVVDGRDIGTVVLPRADVKLYVTALPEVRARRRANELSAIGHDASYEKILEELKLRDQADMNRNIAPLKPAADAHVIDTTSLDADGAFQVAANIVDSVRRVR